MARGTAVLVAAGAIVGTGMAAFASPDDEVPSAAQSRSVLSDEDRTTYERGEVPTADRTRGPVYESFREEIGPFVDDGDIGVVAPIDGKPSGYGSIIVDARNLSAELYWAGDLPEEVAAVIAHHPEVAVHVHRSAYSLAELIAARDALVDRWHSLAPEGYKVQTIGPLRDASGVRVEVTGDEPLSPSASADLAAHLTDLTGVATTVEYTTLVVTPLKALPVP